MTEEYLKLQAKRAWGLKSVEEWSVVAARARKNGKKAHVGIVFGICVEKGSELP